MTRRYSKKKRSGGKKFGAGPLHPTLLSQLFGDFGHFENLVNVVGKDHSEMGPRVPGHVGAEGGFTSVLRILHVPDLWHAASGPERANGERREGE